jgi:sigma-B regulation protein RsbU (phosphoserine phosphatase)
MAYYVGVQSRGVADRDLIASAYDVEAQDWYRRTLAANEPWWSEPYFNETAGGRWMSTLNMPLRTRDGTRLGMISLDVPIARWEELVEPLQNVPGHRVALFAPGGTIALHPDPSIALKTTLSNYIAGGRDDLASMEPGRPAIRYWSRSATPAGACSWRCRTNRSWRRSNAPSPCWPPRPWWRWASPPCSCAGWRCASPRR